eukprot:655531-Pelagomonas_calceolata.AAC.24
MVLLRQLEMLHLQIMLVVSSGAWILCKGRKGLLWIFWKVGTQRAAAAARRGTALPEIWQGAALCRRNMEVAKRQQEQQQQGRVLLYLTFACLDKPVLIKSQLAMLPVASRGYLQGAIAWTAMGGLCEKGKLGCLTTLV